MRLGRVATEAAAARWPDGARQHLDGTLYSVLTLTYNLFREVRPGRPVRLQWTGQSADHCRITSEQSKTAYIHSPSANHGERCAGAG